MENYAGCYGSNQFDRHFESMLDAHLDSIEDNQPFSHDNYEKHQICDCCGRDFEVTEYEEDTIYMEASDEHWVYCMYCDEETLLEFS